MGDGNSQSPITIKLNHLAHSKGSWRAAVLARLEAGESLAEIARSQIVLPGGQVVVVAAHRRDYRHIDEFSAAQKEQIRAKLIHVLKTGRKASYDWQPDDVDAPFMTDRDNGSVLAITFHARPDGVPEVTWPGEEPGGR
ncbi:MAG: hypothetical protein ACKVT1_13760 [Dehalococcoidia bacterium]